MLDDESTKLGEVMVQQKIYSAKHTLYLSKAMMLQLEQLAAKRNGDDATINSVIREALRQYLDNQEDVIGSRRHFQRTLQTHIDTLRQSLEFNAQLNTRLTAFCFAYVINGLMQKPITATQLIERAAKDTKRYETEFTDLIKYLRTNFTEDAKE
jgi:CII-binding regulator of phage lambda lysogenization HflD